MIRKIILIAFIMLYSVLGNAFAEETNTRNYYGINESFQTVEHGKVTTEEACEIVDNYIKNQIGLKGDAGYVISRSMFGFHINGNTFIEIYIDNENTYRIKFETPEANNRSFGPIQTNIYQKEINVPDKDTLKEIVKIFFTHDIENFKKYFDNL